MSYYGGGWISIIWGIFCFVGSYNIGNSYLMTKINNREESEFKTQNAFGKINLKINNFNSIRLLGLLDDYEFSPYEIDHSLTGVKFSIFRTD
ncbi:MAG: hypothetical protein KAW19_06065 [Candidatus Aminicenantes bacterium]|nr:hypothetical protein [Candidatus Aminicenantes bacterium]